MTLRRWLAENKVFFDTIATVSLTAMSLIVSVGAFIVSNRQLALSEAERAPAFELDYGRMYRGDLAGPLSTEERGYTDAFAELKNYGAAVIPVRLECQAILVLDNPNGVNTRWVPLTDATDIDLHRDVAQSGTQNLALIRWRPRADSVFVGMIFDACFQDKIQDACEVLGHNTEIDIFKLAFRDKLGRSQETYLALGGSELREGELRHLFKRAAEAQDKFSFGQARAMKFTEFLKLARY